ncbi:hypothetical protein VP01_2248g3 [Puccinia sorghi]|uniref:Uncharacterized protein n=1 Tax=Puccinia sorghi TaxID=27349 RepID=A0A0L6V8N8_9BASI|nr:hypothetical protein VP01_2248g3 [Puccinia sorghi]
MYFTPEIDKVLHFWTLIYRDRSPISTLNKWDGAIYRTLYEVLDEREKRYFSYLSLRTFKLYFVNVHSKLYDLLIEDDHLFHTLEEYFANFSKNSLSKAKNELNHGDINQYSSIRNKGQALNDIVQALIDEFQNSGYESSRNVAFFFLDFIQHNYSLDIVDVQKGELFQDKMNSMSSRFQLLAELKNIKWYLAKKTSQLTSKDDMKSIGGEVVMIYKYYHHLLPKIQQLLSLNEFNHHILDFEIQHRGKLHIEKTIEKIMSVNKYYSLK